MSDALGDSVSRVNRGREIDRIYVDGHVDPVIVEDDDVILPAWARPLARRIHLVVIAALK